VLLCDRGNDPAPDFFLGCFELAITAAYFIVCWNCLLFKLDEIPLPPYFFGIVFAISGYLFILGSILNWPDLTPKALLIRPFVSNLLNSWYVLV